jgi:hypothetical protein
MAINDRELTEYEKEMYYRAKLEKEKSNQDSTKRMLRLKKY